MATRAQFGLKGKVKDAYLELVCAFPLASIQSDQVRVSGRNKDDLQAVMALLKGEDYGLPLQFTNYR